jgi:hypothetical protein
VADTWDGRGGLMPETWYLDTLIGLMLKLQKRNQKLEERIYALDKQVGQRPYQEGKLRDTAKAMV